MITIRDLLTILDAKVLCGEEQLDEARPAAAT